MFVDVTKIGESMSTPVGLTWGLAMMILPFLFTASIVTEQAKVVKGEQPQYNELIWTLVWVVLGMVAYQYIFNKIVFFCEGLGACILSFPDWATFLETVKDKVFDAQPISILAMGATALFMVAAHSLLLALDTVFNIVRFAFLSILYVIGPFALVCAVYKPLRSFCRGWFTNVFQISFWIVISRIFQVVLVYLQAASYIKNDDAAVSIAVSFSVIIFYLSTPMFTARLINGQTLGPIAGAVLMGGAFVASKIAGAARGILPGRNLPDKTNRNKSSGGTQSPEKGDSGSTQTSPGGAPGISRPIPRETVLGVKSKPKEQDTTPRPEKTR